MGKLHVVLTGSSSGLGHAILDTMKDVGQPMFHVTGIDLFKPIEPGLRQPDQFLQIDLGEPNEIARACERIGPVDILINCAGINRISPIEDLTVMEWEDLMDVNAKALFLTVKNLLPRLADSKGVILNVVSNAYKMPMTHSLAYNASKGAAEIMTRQMARELTKSKGITVFGINPNKMAGTVMSEYIESRVPEMRGWTPEQAKQYQLNGITCGFETDPYWIAEMVVWLLSKPTRHQYLSGCMLDLGD